MDRKLKLKEPETRSININDDYALEFGASELGLPKKPVGCGAGCRHYRC